MFAPPLAFLQSLLQLSHYTQGLQGRYGLAALHTLLHDRQLKQHFLSFGMLDPFYEYHVGQCPLPEIHLARTTFGSWRCSMYVLTWLSLHHK